MDCRLLPTAAGDYRCDRCGWSYPRDVRHTCPAAPRGIAADEPAAMLAAAVARKVRLGLSAVDLAEVERRLALCRGCPRWNAPRQLCGRDAGGCSGLARFAGRLTAGGCPRW